MADCLVYWKYFRDEAYEDEANAFAQHWFTRTPYFFDQIKPGNNLWVVVSGGRRFPQEWRLLQRILVRALKPEKAFRPFHAIGDAKKSQIFDIRRQGDLAPLLRKLEGEKGDANLFLTCGEIEKLKPMPHGSDVRGRDLEDCCVGKGSA